MPPLGDKLSTHETLGNRQQLVEREMEKEFHGLRRGAEIESDIDYTHHVPGTLLVLHRYSYKLLFRGTSKAGEKAERSRALTGLPKDPGLIPRIHMAAHNHP